MALYRYWRASVSLHTISPYDAKCSPPAVQQEQPEDLLTFLAEVAAGTPIGEHVDALAHHARAQKLQAREIDLQEQKMKYLEISAEIKLEKITYERPDDVTHQFDGTMHISQPNALKEIRINEISYPWKEADFMTRLERKQISSDVRIQSRVIHGRDVTDENFRLPVARNLAIDLELLDHLSWGETHAHVERRLEWPDLEAHPKAQWKFPIYNRKLQSASESPQNGEKEDVKQLHGTAAEIGNAASSQKTPSLLRKVLKHR